MGVWPWLFPLRGDDAESLLRQPRCDEPFNYAGEDSEVRPVAKRDTHRLWHTVHVPLTGMESDGADPPASCVVWEDGHRCWWEGFRDAEVLLSPEQVRGVADLLDAAGYDALLSERVPATRSGELWVYPFEAGTAPRTPWTAARSTGLRRTARLLQRGGGRGRCRLQVAGVAPSRRPSGSAFSLKMSPARHGGHLAARPPQGRGRPATFACHPTTQRTLLPSGVQRFTDVDTG